MFHSQSRVTDSRAAENSAVKTDWSLSRLWMLSVRVAIQCSHLTEPG